MWSYSAFPDRLAFPIGLLKWCLLSKLAGDRRPMAECVLRRLYQSSEPPCGRFVRDDNRGVRDGRRDRGRVGLRREGREGWSDGACQRARWPCLAGRSRSPERPRGRARGRQAERGADIHRPPHRTTSAKRIAPRVGLSVRCEPESRRDRPGGRPDADEGETRGERSATWRDKRKKWVGRLQTRARRPGAAGPGLERPRADDCSQSKGRDAKGRARGVSCERREQGRERDRKPST
jgi:hypothetical protein